MNGAYLNQGMKAKLLFKWADLIEKDVDYLSKVRAMNSTRLISETSQGDVYGTAGYN